MATSSANRGASPWTIALARRPSSAGYAKAEQERWWELQRAAEAARKRMGNWPFAAAWREWTPSGEVAYVQRLID